MPDNYRPSQGNPYYNPLMSTPDWGAGIRDTLNQMWSYRKYQEQLDEDKRRWESENALQQKQVDFQQKRAEAESEESRSRAKYYSSQAIAALGKIDTNTGINPTTIKAMGNALGWEQAAIDYILAQPPAVQKTLADNLLSDYGQLQKEKRIQAGPAAEAAEDRRRRAAEEKERREREAMLKRHGGAVSAATTLIQGLRPSVYKQIEAIDKDPMNLDKDVAKQPLQAALDYIEQAAGEVAAYNMKLAQGTELSDEEFAKLTQYLNNYKKIKTGEFWAEQEPQSMPSLGTEPNPEEVQLTAREIINRAGRSGKQISEEDAVALAIQFLKSKQNAPR